MSAKSRERRADFKKTQMFRRFMAKARLYDWLKLRPEFASDMFDEAVVIDATPLSDVVSSKLSDLSEALIPPYRVTFIEMGKVEVGGFPMGWLFAWFGDGGDDRGELDAYFEEECACFMLGVLFGCMTPNSELGVMGKWCIGLTSEYQFKAIHPINFPYDSPEYLRSVAEFGNDGMMAYNGMCVIGLKVLQLINCQNIRLIDPQPDAEREMVNRDLRVATGRSLVKFKTLAIKRGKKNGVDAQAEYIPFDIMALHLRRGNFAHYSDDAPLFGKFTGTFWRPATVVGNPKNGVVVKDYKVQAPHEPEPAL